MSVLKQTVSEPRGEASSEEEHIDVCEEEKTDQKNSQNQFNQEMASSELTNDSTKESNPGQSESEERAFIMNLYQFMKEEGTPIERIPHLGFKQTQHTVCVFHQVTTRRLWKNVYDELGGSPGSTSAATCTRRHYERLVLPYERHRRGEEDKPLPPSKPRKQYKRSEEGKGKNEGKKRRRTDGDDPEEHLRCSHPCGRGVCSHSGPWPVSSKHLDSVQVLSQDMCLGEKSLCQLVMSPLEKKKRLAQASLCVAPSVGLEDETESERPSVIHRSHSSTSFRSVHRTWSLIPSLSSPSPFPLSRTTSNVRSSSPPSTAPSSSTVSPVRSLSPPSPPSRMTSPVRSLSPPSSSPLSSTVSPVRSLCPRSPCSPINPLTQVHSLSPRSPLSSGSPSHLSVSSEDCVAVPTQKSPALKTEKQKPAHIRPSSKAVMRTCQPLPQNHYPCPTDTSSLPHPLLNLPNITSTQADKTQRHPTLQKPVPVPLSSACWVPRAISSFTKVVPRSREPWKPVSLQRYGCQIPNFKRQSNTEPFGKKTPAPLRFLDRNDKSKMVVPKPMLTQQYLMHQSGLPTFPYLFSGFNRAGTEALDQMKAFPLQPVLLPHLSIPPAQTHPAHPPLQGPLPTPYEAGLRQYPYSVPVWHPPPGYSMTTLQPY
ncbi:AT-rich interactive domain-containing protein 5A [Bagarius yarrelli]|uniref:AT-rich interactive domain-containing protein 5A n=1 Tax=Bagarius yarrelli TaxID=175774 RepID=A0A556VWP9_BAGYA|nr:AT-rich interactive domain-containing protein 5A [Bagarius yarrelli]